MSQPRDTDRTAPPTSPYVSDGEGVTIEHGNVRELAKAMADDSTAFGGAIGNARARLFGDLGFSTAATFGVDPRNPRAAQMMKFHNAAFERAVGAADEHAKNGEIYGGLVGLTAAALDQADDTAGGVLKAAGDFVSDSVDRLTGGTRGEVTR